MINVNTYVVTEQAVYRGVAAGVEKLLQDASAFSKPEVVIETLSESVMQEMCVVMDFGNQPMRFTPDMMARVWAAMQPVKEVGPTTS